MWDDGLVSDLKIIEIIKKLGVKSTFAISPSKHKKIRVTNDNRGNYGTLVSIEELKEFKDFEICNHGDNHLDLSKINQKQTEEEIVNGKKKLEEIFSKQIDGFCYAYGVFTFFAKKALSSIGTKYARTTKQGFSSKDRLLLHPTLKWNQFNSDKLIMNSNLILWGHTYEIETKKDWNDIKTMYEYMAQNPEIKIIDFTEMVERICY